MRIEAVTVCIGYDDFLTVSAQHNRSLFDRWIVVTSPNDKATIKVCQRFNLGVLLTEEGTRDGEFNKGHLVQRAQRLLSSGAWRLHLDADIVCPSTLRKSLITSDLDPNKVYGADRVLVKSWDRWQRLLQSGYLQNQHDYHYRMRFPAGYDIGTRWVSPSHGWVPIGFFQLWHGDADEANGVQVKAYPNRHGSANRTDVQHGLQWDRRHRELLPEVIVVHLESEEAKLGANWAGRCTKRFGPDTLGVGSAGKCPS